MAIRKKETLFEFPNPMDNDCLIGHKDTLKTFTEAWANREKRYLTLDHTGNLVCYDTKTKEVCKNF